MFRNRIDILNLDKCLHVLLKHASEELLEFTSAEVLENLAPLRWFSEVAQIRPHVTAQNAEGRRLANTVCAHEPEHLPGAGGRQSVQLEAIGAVAVRDLALQALRQVDDFDCLERAPLDAHAAAVAEMFRDEANCGRRLHVDTDLANLVHWARLCALLPALFGLTLIGVDDSDSELLIGHFSF